MKLFLTIIILGLFSHAVNASDMAEASSTICQKVKSCGTAQLESQGLPPEMVVMMKSMFDGMCETMIAPYIMKTTDAGLEKKAIACLDTINTMSCDDLMNGQGNETQECKEFKKAADEAGIETE